ncbi:hypothetical protein MHU86_7655 [Fragilaria crotonensis]|nr:hypothetical protein MHU86_7655 [Fragilaria crotonensis]
MARRIWQPTSPLSQHGRHDPPEGHKMVDFSDSCLPQEEYPWGIFRGKASDIFFNEDYTDSASAYSGHAEAMKWLYNHFLLHNEALAHEIDADWPLLWNRMQ